jgi:hypothetical protein
LLTLEARVFFMAQEQSIANEEIPAWSGDVCADLPLAADPQQSVKTVPNNPLHSVLEARSSRLSSLLPQARGSRLVARGSPLPSLLPTWVPRQLSLQSAVVTVLNFYCAGGTTCPV